MMVHAAGVVKQARVRKNAHMPQGALCGAQAEGLPGDGGNTHAFARVSVGVTVQHTPVVWQSEAPRWDEKLAFK